ncbi:MAG: SpoVA/SpoVAEb family sporulation membrane protein [Eubacterium sp.]|nr:SpoVA/SpoVAEb family sporulation membrane protein [Eubacterium sp.]
MIAITAFDGFINNILSNVVIFILQRKIKPKLKARKTFSLQQIPICQVHYSTVHKKSTVQLWGRVLGTIVPISGFANSVVAPALEFQHEGYVLGTAAQMFSIAGPVLVYGTATSVVYGLIIYIFKLY